MSKPEDIPHDVWDAAQAAFYAGRAQSLYVEQIATIARAILAERERCAKLADGYFSNESDDYSNGQDDTAERIAAAIRKGAA